MLPPVSMDVKEYPQNIELNAICKRVNLVALDDGNKNGSL